MIRQNVDKGKQQQTVVPVLTEQKQVSMIYFRNFYFYMHKFDILEFIQFFLIILFSFLFYEENANHL